MNKYKVTVNHPTEVNLSLSNFQVYKLESHDTLSGFARKLAMEGFFDGFKWIMPAAILTVESVHADE